MFVLSFNSNGTGLLEEEPVDSPTSPKSEVEEPIEQEEPIPTQLEPFEHPKVEEVKPEPLEPQEQPLGQCPV